MHRFSKILAIALVLTALVFAPPALAQDSSATFDFQKSYEDYIHIYEQYKKAHSDYLLARSQYLQANTLASQTKAQEKTALMLQARDDVVVAYLTMLRLRLLEAEGVAASDKDSLYARLDNQISWFKAHKDQVPSAGTLEDLTKDSKAASTQYQLVIPLAYETLAIIPIGQLEVFKNELNQILGDIKTKTEKIRAKGDHDTSIIERWIIETENKLSRGFEKQIQAQTGLYSLQKYDPKSSRRNPPEDIYSDIVTYLNESNQFFREASSNMREIIKLIKTAQS